MRWQRIRVWLAYIGIVPWWFTFVIYTRCAVCGKRFRRHWPWNYIEECCSIKCMAADVQSWTYGPSEN